MSRGARSTDAAITLVLPEAETPRFELRARLCLAGFSVAWNPPSRSALVVKVDGAGRPPWSTSVMPTTRGESFGCGVAGTAAGGCAIAGHTTEGSAGGLDLLFATLAAEGRTSSGDTLIRREQPVGIAAGTASLCPANRTAGASSPTAL